MEDLLTSVAAETGGGHEGVAPTTLPSLVR